MATLELLREDLDGEGNPSKHHVVFVPGISASNIPDQTCSHFDKWVHSCCFKPKRLWKYDHGLDFGGSRSMNEFCTQAPEHLLQMLCQNCASSDSTLFLIGHKLGVFLLKKALILAQDRKHHVRNLFDAIDNILMIGDPDLGEDKQAATELLQEYLPNCVTSDCLDALERHLDSLKSISDEFEKDSIQSHLFQVNRGTPSRRTSRSRRVKNRGCMENANLTVRMWSTANDVDHIAVSDPDDKTCIFAKKSKHYLKLRRIANNEYQRELERIHDEKYALLVANADAKDFSPVADVSTGMLTAFEARELPDTTGQESTEAMSDVDSILEMSDSRSTNSSAYEQSDLPLGFTTSDAGSVSPGGHKLDDSTSNIALCRSQTTSEPRPPTIALEPTGLPQNKQFRGLEDMPTQLVLNVRTRKLHFRRNIPPVPIPFIGRADVMESLNACFFGHNVPSSASMLALQRVAILQGALGIGKTAAARVFVDRFATKYDHVFWIKSCNLPSIRTSVHEATVGLGLTQERMNYIHSESKAKLLAWLGETNLSWLLVFDDADHLDQILPYIPHEPKGQILITSRSRDSEVLEKPNRSITRIEVSPLSQAESLTFMSSLFPMNERHANWSLVERTVMEMRGHPLGLRLASARMQPNRDDSFDRCKLLGLQSTLSRISGSSGVAGIEAMAILPDLAWANFEDLSSEAYDLVSLCCHLSTDDLPDSLFLEGQNCRKLELHIPLHDQTFRVAKQEIIASKFMISVGSASACMDRASSEILKSYMTFDKRRAAISTACDLLLAQWPSQRKLKAVVFGAWPEFDSLYLHVYALAQELWKIGPADAKTLPVDLKENLADLLLRTMVYNNKIRRNVFEDIEVLGIVETLRSTEKQEIRAVTDTTSSQTPISSGLPSRLIEIDHEAEDWRLVDVDDTSSRYCALKYSWTADDFPRLTSSSLASYQDGKWLADGPTLLREASAAAKALGLNYIWVDSLCILQDDLDDKLNHLSTMHDIYANASVVLMHHVSSSRSIWVPQSRPRILPSSQHALEKLDTSTEFFIHETALNVLNDSVRIIWTIPWQGFLGPKSSRVWLGSDDDHVVTSDAANPAIGAQEKSDLLSTDDKVELLNYADEGARQGIDFFCKGEYARATFRFLNARDVISRLEQRSPSDDMQYLLYSTYLAIVALEENAYQEAKDIIDAGLRFVTTNFVLDSSDSSDILGRAYMLQGDADNALGHNEDASKNYDKAATIITDRCATLFHVLQMRRSDILCSDRKFADAHLLIQAAIDHFETQETRPGRAQYARALYKKAMLFQAEGDKRKTRVALGGARGALEDLYEDEGAGKALPEELTTEVFNSEVVFGFR